MTVAGDGEDGAATVAVTRCMSGSGARIGHRDDREQCQQITHSNCVSRMAEEVVGAHVGLAE